MMSVTRFVSAQGKVGFLKPCFVGRVTATVLEVFPFLEPNYRAMGNIPIFLHHLATEFSEGWT